MGKLTKIANGIVGQYLYFCTTLKSFIKSLENYVNDLNKINRLVQIVNDILNDSLDPNITNYPYTNHPIYGNAWHCHIQSDFILVYDFDENGNLILIDLINHNEQ